MSAGIPLLIQFLVMLFSIVCHEVAHGFAAYIHGDNTAHDQGRLTLNPIPHIDLFGSIILPVVSHYFGYPIGWAKPVPYNPRNLRGKYAETWVASAGVLTNFLLAFLSVLIFKILVATGDISEQIQNILMLIASINIFLGVFNLIPFPPFDGMSIIQSLFPSLKRYTGLAYNPMYMIGIIIAATFIFNLIIPYLFILIDLLF